jgi:murein DD-endopeptidase MepM/ murein hydrolase activator NlpD
MRVKLIPAILAILISPQANACGELLMPLIQFSRQSQGYHSGHNGVDLVAPFGSQIISANDGVISFIGWNGSYGRMVEIDHEDGVTTRYGHLSKFSDKLHVGSRVSIGQTIGYIGSSGVSTGPHLHFEVRIYDVPKNPDPYIGLYCPKSKIK